MTSRRHPDATDPVLEPVLGPTSGAISGWFGVVLALVVLIAALTDRGFGDTPVLVAASLLGLVLVWTFLLRPRVVLKRDAILLRNGFVDHEVSWGLVDRVQVRTVTRVYAGERCYVGTAVGRSTFRMVRDERRGGSGPAETVLPSAMAAGANLPDFLEARAADRIFGARHGEGQARRLVAWPELITTVVLLAALVAALVV